MDRKIKLFVVASTVAVMASGCSGYRAGSTQAMAGANSGSGAVTSGMGAGSTQATNTNQVSRGGLFSQQRANTCTPCGGGNVVPKSTYTYKPAPKPAYKPAPRPAGKHNQQYYIDRWNRQQTQQRQQPKQKTQNYAGYGSGNYNSNAGTSNTNYYDYSSAGKTAPAPAANVSASNKSIYTGSYQQPTYKPYQPTTYSGGSAATTNTTTTYAGASTTVTSAGGSSYTVKKGDTVFEVMRQTGVYWKDIISMNNLIAPAYTISPGQRLRLK